jgi:hypothetical protein
MPVYGQVGFPDLTVQAESLASQAIDQAFKGKADLSSVQVVLLGDRNGDIIPILTATVSRTQWQANPQVSAWSKYYSASYAFLQRSQEVLAALPSQIRAFQLRKSKNSLTGAAAQAMLSSMD